MITDFQNQQRIRVLLVDDDEDAFILTRDSFRQVTSQKYELTWESSFNSGLSAMARNEHDAYLVDYQLGSRNGLELIQDARDQGCSGAIVFLTGMENEYLDMMALTHGASDYLVKGNITPQLLDRAIRYSRQHQKDLNTLQLSSRELQRVNSELRASEQRLTELNASKDRFFSIIAHDLKNPFVSLLGYSELLSADIHVMKQEDIQLSAAMLHQVGTRLYRLLENLLKWSRLQTGTIPYHPVDLDLADMVYHTTMLYSAAAGKKSIRVVSTIPTGTHAISDAFMMSTILDNLLSNAIKYTPRGGVIEFHTHAQGNRMHLEIRDSGIGIPPNELQDLFRIDRRLSVPGTEQEEGTGLGLILCKELAERCSVNLEVTSTVGHGSTFRLVIPVDGAIHTGLSDTLPSDAVFGSSVSGFTRT